MKKIPNYAEKIKKIEGHFEYLHGVILDAFKEIYTDTGLEYEIEEENKPFKAIKCGDTRKGFFPYKITYTNGQIELWKMNENDPDYKVTAWKTVESFKQNFYTHISSQT